MQEQTIFDFLYNKYKITNKVRLIELFAGIGSQAKALKNIGANFEHYKVVEFDKYAIASYNAIHNTNFSTLDITKIKGSDLEIIDTDKFTYLLTYSFPCQDLSLAGKQKGMSKDSNTRSGLLWEVERILNEIEELPQLLLMENVPMVHSKDNIQDFQKWILALEKLGYKSYWKDLNAKNYGIPQNRNRTFMISILGDYNYNFPKKKKLNLRLKDMLEDDVDEKYYLSDKMINYITAENEKWTGNNENLIINRKIATTINTGEGHRRCDAINYICNELPENTDLKNDKAYQLMKIILKNNQINEFPCCCDSTLNDPQVREITNCITSRYNAGIQNQKQIGLCVITKNGLHIPLYKENKRLIETINENDFFRNKPLNLDLFNRAVYQNSQTLTDGKHDTQRLWDGLRIRKLTPKECFRLMGFSDEDFEKASKVNSNAQLYKQAGNSIVVNVLEAIFKELF